MSKFNSLITAVTLLCINSVASAAVDEIGGTMDGLQVSVGDCLVATPQDKPTAGTERSALAAIAGAVISQGVNYLGRALTAAGAARTWTLSGARNIQATSASFPQCVIVVRGSFVTDGKPTADWAHPEGWPKDLRNELRWRGIFLSAAPDFIFEGKIISANDQSALTIRPVIVTYVKPIGTRNFRPGGERNVALFLAITPPGIKPTLETSPAATIVLGNLKPATTRKFEDSLAYSSPYESPWFSLTKADSIKPLTVTALLSETQDKAAFATFLGTIFSDPKVVTEANTQLTQLLIPSVGAQAASDAVSKAAITANDADTKLVLMLAKLNACKDADAANAASAGADARTAMRNYWLADSAQAAPRADVQLTLIDAIDLREKSDIIKTKCAAALAGLIKP